MLYNKGYVHHLGKDRKVRLFSLDLNTRCMKNMGPLMYKMHVPSLTPLTERNAVTSQHSASQPMPYLGMKYPFFFQENS